MIQAVAILMALAPAQEAVEQAKVDDAVRRGSAFLLKKYEKGFDLASWNSTLELVMLTLNHAGVPADDPVFQKGLLALGTCPLQYTYRVAALAMALQRIDPRKFQERIAHCAQWLVDTQLNEGEWGYPGTLNGVDEAPGPVDVDPPKLEKKEVKEAGTTSALLIRRRPHAKVTSKVKGDISNAQFALLGLKAAADAGIEVPKATWEAALRYFLTSQNRDGGWGYTFNGHKDTASYASMVCAAVCSVAICRYGLGLKEPQKDAAVRAGLAWLGKNFHPDSNANAEKSKVADPKRWLYYYLYSIERVGRIVAVDEIGRQKWYPVGAKSLLSSQKADGSWFTGLVGVWKQAGDLETADTCFAILFLTKATPPLVATEGGKSK